MTDILVEDHAEVGTLLGGLLEAFDGGEASEVLPKLDYVWARLAMHIRAEHLHLFPALTAAAEVGGAARGEPSPHSVREPVERLREEHDFFMRELAAAVNGVRALCAEGGRADAERLRPFRDGVLAVAERLEAHNGLEEEQVYQWTVALLGEEARAELRARMKREIESFPPRFSEGAPNV